MKGWCSLRIPPPGAGVTHVSGVTKFVGLYVPEGIAALSGIEAAAASSKTILSISRSLVPPTSDNQHHISSRWGLK